MNLAEIRGSLAKLNLEILKERGKLSELTGYYHYNNLKKLKDVINKLSVINILAYDVDVLKSSELYAERGIGIDSVAIGENSESVIDRRLSSLYQDALFIKQFLESELPEDKDDSIRIKLPPVKDFDDIGKVMNELKKAISIPIIQEEAGQVIVEYGEAGSVWLFVYLGAKKAVRLMAELGWAAMVILNKKNELNYVAQQLETYKIGKEYIAAIAESQKKILTDLVEGEAMGVHNRINEDAKPLDPETHQRLILSLNTLADLYERGFKMLPSLSVNEDVKNLFPSSTVEKLIESRNKQLPEGGSSDLKD